MVSPAARRVSNWFQREIAMKADFAMLAVLACAPAALAQGAPNAPGLAEARTRLAAQPDDVPAQHAFVDAAVREALAARSAGDPDRALATLLHGRETLPHDPTLLLDFGLQADSMRLFRDADTALTEALALRPSDPATVYALGRVRLDEGKLPEAETLLRQYLALRPADATAIYGLGKLLHLELKDDEAAAELKRSLALQPAQTESHYQLGDIALGLHRDTEAQAEFAQVLARDPNHPGALAGTGVLALRRKDYAEAAKLLRQSLAAAPNYPETHRNLALALAKLGRKEESEQELATAARLGEAQEQARGGLVIEKTREIAPE